MKRFLLFCYDTYYPVGARQDLQGDFDTLEEAVKKAKELKYDNTDILDLKNQIWAFEDRTRLYGVKK